MCAPAEYGDSCADFYDDLYGPCRAKVLNVLIASARQGKALELGVGTGRTAIPLARRGIHVTGIEISTRMLSELSRKPGSELITTIQGNFARATFDGMYDLIYVLCSTLHLLPSYSEQLECFHNVARHVASNGCFLVEANLPYNCAAGTTSGDRRISERFVLPTSAGSREYCVDLFQSTPEELDTMACSAGLELSSRWADWDRAAFARSTDRSHISIYRHRQSGSAHG